MNLQIHMCVLLSAGAVWSDLKWLRIENRFLAVFLLLGIPVNLLTAEYGYTAAAETTGGNIWTESLIGLLLPLVLLWVFRLFRMIGAGDIKLLSVLGWYMGRQILQCLWWTFLFALLLSVMILLDEGMAAERFRYLKNYAGAYLRSGKRTPYRQPGFHRESLHMTVPVWMSVLLYAAGVYGK